MAHTNQERWATLVDAKLRSQLVTRDNLIFNNRYEGEPTAEDLVNELQLYGKRLAYTLALPKGDAHDWHDVTVEFFGQRFRTYGDVTEGIETMIPLHWNKKVKVERYG